MFSLFSALLLCIYITTSTTDTENDHHHVRSSPHIIIPFRFLYSKKALLKKVATKRKEVYFSSSNNPKRFESVFFSPCSCAQVCNDSHIGTCLNISMHDETSMMNRAAAHQNNDMLVIFLLLCVYALELVVDHHIIT